MYIPALTASHKEPFPAALAEAERIFLEIQPDYLMGDSAGAGLVVALLLRMRERNEITSGERASAPNGKP